MSLAHGPKTDLGYLVEAMLQAKRDARFLFHHESSASFFLCSKAAWTWASSANFVAFLASSHRPFNNKEDTSLSLPNATCVYYYNTSLRSQVVFKAPPVQTKSQSKQDLALFVSSAYVVRIKDDSAPQSHPVPSAARFPERLYAFVPDHIRKALKVLRKFPSCVATQLEAKLMSWSSHGRISSQPLASVALRPNFWHYCSSSRNFFLRSSSARSALSKKHPWKDYLPRASCFCTDKFKQKQNSPNKSRECLSWSSHRELLPWEWSSSKWQDPLPGCPRARTASSCIRGWLGCVICNHWPACIS